MSATSLNPSRRRCRGALGGKGCRAGPALHAAVGEVVDAVRAERDRAVLGGPDEDPTHVRVLAQRGNESRVALLDLLEGQPAGLLHQVDEPEIP